MGHNQDKCYESNKKAKLYLKEKGYIDIELFPHTKYKKDVHIGELAFDGVCRNISHILFFQIKSNQRPTKIQIEEMNKLSTIYNGFVKFGWVNCPDRNPIEIFGL